MIDCYFLLLKDRNNFQCRSSTSKRPSHFFSTTFFTKLFDNSGSYNFSAVERWSRKLSLFLMEMIFFPIHYGGNHWTLMVIFVQTKRIFYFDSLGGNGDYYTTRIKQWLKDVARTQDKFTLDVRDWTVESPFANPRQENGDDCGVFVCMCADFISEQLPLFYTQKDMKHFRMKIATDLLRGSFQT